MVSQYKILVVDDDHDILDLILDDLSELKAQLFEASDFKQALKVIEDRRPNIVVTDVILPNGSGIELLKKAKIIAPETIFIVMTGYDDQKIAVDAIKHEAYGFLSKPFTDQELISSVNRAIELLELKKTTFAMKEREQRRLILSSKLVVLGQMVTEIIHEIKNPLTSIMGLVQIVNDFEDLNEKTHKNLDVVLNQCERIVELLNKLGHSSEVSNDPFKTVNLVEIINRNIKLMAKVFERKSITIKIDLGDEGLAIEGNESNLDTVFQNLLVNSKDAFERVGDNRKKEISISSCKIGSKQWILYQDNAAGMSHDTLEKVFEPFFTTKEVGNGSGLGLSIAYTIIKNHGGHVMVESKEGVGSLFKLFFPLNNAQIDVSDDQSKSKDDQSAHSTQEDAFKPRVLLVDDDKAFLNYLRDLIAPTFDVLAVDSANKALRSLKDQSFELILTDFLMPGMNGIELIESIERKVPVVIMTASGFSEHLKDINCGANPVKLIQKPFSKDDIIELIHNTISKK